MSLRQNIVAQFRRPHGTLGHLAGYIMANRPSNIERNEWTLELLALEPGDRLLEVGFGPGIAIAQASRTITRGLIAGIDHSEAMLHQARKRNSAAIRRGTVELYRASVEALPPFDEPFDKIYSVNVVQFWREPVQVFEQLRSRLAVGGIIATTYMPRHRGATDSDAYAKAREVVRQLEAAGFSSIRVEEKRMQPVSAMSVLAINTV